MTFGQRLKQLMADRDITQRQLSLDLNIAVTTLSGYANDHREPDFLTLSQLAQYFHVSTDYLLGIASTPAYPAAPINEDIQRLLYYYEKLSPDLRGLLIEQAKILWKYMDFQSENSENKV